MVVPLHWWKERGAFVDALYASAAGDSGGEGGRGGWVWLSEQESEERKTQLQEAMEGEDSPLPAWMLPVAHETCREMFAGAVPLAHRGGYRADRWMRKLHNPMLYGDPSRPEQVWLALDEGMPALLWVPAGTSAESLAEAWAPYAWPETEEPLPTALSLPRSFRFYVGSEQEMGGEFDAIQQFFRSLPGADSLPWGSKFADDPWPNRPVGIELAAAGYRMPENSMQVEGAVPSISMRSRRLGSVITVSSLNGFVVVELRYAPAKHASVLPALTGLLPGLPKGLPSDLPVDVLAVVARLIGRSAVELAEDLRDPEQASSLGYNTMASIALMGDDGAAARALFKGLFSLPDPKQRAIAYHVASVVHHGRLLHEAYARETDAENLQALRDFLKV